MNDIFIEWMRADEKNENPPIGLNINQKFNKYINLYIVYNYSYLHGNSFTLNTLLCVLCRWGRKKWYNWEKEKLFCSGSVCIEWRMHQMNFVKKILPNKCAIASFPNRSIFKWQQFVYSLLLFIFFRCNDKKNITAPFNIYIYIYLKFFLLHVAH